MASLIKQQLYDKGLELIHEFCLINDLLIPDVIVIPSKQWKISSTCAYYRNSAIVICLEKCSSIGTGGTSWSYPGYVVDRTPYGVLAHELGHHIDMFYSTVKNKYMGNNSTNVRNASGEPKLTNYCPNDGEWFAEMMRLFITNPNLLSILRPKTFNIIRQRLVPEITESWQDVLENAPERTKNAVLNKIKQISK